MWFVLLIHLIHLVRLADQPQIDQLQAAERKLSLNEAKYPAERVRGSPKKNPEYDQAASAAHFQAASACSRAWVGDCPNQPLKAREKELVSV